MKQQVVGQATKPPLSRRRHFLQLTANAVGTFEIPSRSNPAGRFAAAENRDMPTLSSGLLRAGLALKLSQIKLATRSYLRDRTKQATGTVTAYAIGAGLFAAAGVFLIAACLVGATALFRWIEFKYGLFFAFGAVGALLLMVAAICAALAVNSIKRPPPHFPSLASRLRVAIKANPIHPDRLQDPASAVLLTSSDTTKRIRNGSQPERNGLQTSAGLLLVATLLGWAAARRWQQARRLNRRGDADFAPRYEIRTTSYRE
jgi:Putative Actinobacterial Holin-X, holin superfamily III